MANDVGATLQRLADRVRETGVTVAVAESLTGGGLSAQLARAPRSSTWFRGGIVAYTSEVKYELLDVPRGPVVSEPAARAMAESAARLLGADLTVAATGVGGPEEQDGQPPGTVWMALHDGRSTTAFCCKFSGDAPEVLDATIRTAIQTLCERVEGDRG